MPLSKNIFSSNDVEQIIKIFYKNIDQTLGDEHSGELSIKAVFAPNPDPNNEGNPKIQRYLITCKKGDTLITLDLNYHHSYYFLMGTSPFLFALIFDLPENHPFLIFLKPFAEDSSLSPEENNRTDGQAVTEALINYLTLVEPKINEYYYSYNEGTAELNDNTVTFKIVINVDNPEVIFSIQAPVQYFKAYFPKLWNYDFFEEQLAIIRKMKKLTELNFSEEALAEYKAELKAKELLRNEPYGMALAQKVYQKLKEANFINGGGQHRDYCGVGFAIGQGIDDDKAIVYGKFYDGYPYPFSIDKAFQNPEDFIEWLAVQSDKTMDGHDETDPFFRNNQRITKGLLQWFVSNFKL